MNVDGAFAIYQGRVNADKTQMAEARRRRSLFVSALMGDRDVVEVKPSGSLARGTQKRPIHDVDLLVVFDRDEHPQWGNRGDSAKGALDHLQTRIRELLGTAGSFAEGEVRLTRWRNHAVKCFLDDPDDHNAFTVDATPALRDGDRFLIPEATNNCWVPTDPQLLIDEVAARHHEWDKYAGTARMLKAWAATQPTKIKSLVIEVLALDHLPTGRLRPVAIKEFFAGAAYQIESGKIPTDPAGICGEIQHDLDLTEFAECLRVASNGSARACHAQAQGDDHRAVQQWGFVFGADFPAPPSTTPAVPPVVVPPRPVKDTPQG